MTHLQFVIANVETSVVCRLLSLREQRDGAAASVVSPAVHSNVVLCRTLLDISQDVSLVELIGAAGEKTQDSFNHLLFFQKEEKSGTTRNDMQRDARKPRMKPSWKRK